jgi:hypothetical protein
MSQPLLFVCRQGPPANAEVLPSLHFVELESPTGPVFMAFASHALAVAIVQFYGTAPGVFLLPETDLPSHLVGPITTHRVVLLHTIDDYAGATGNREGFPWPDRTILYDFVAAMGMNPGQPQGQGE